jgi:hypothetical protein
MTRSVAPRARVTKDLALAAFMNLNELEVVRAKRKGRDFEFTFRDPEDRWEALTIEFVNSRCRRYDDSMRTLKKLASGNGYC